jgi:alpha-tubulin suppressor-like RCC1 family protein
MDALRNFVTECGGSSSSNSNNSDSVNAVAGDIKPPEENSSQNVLPSTPTAGTLLITACIDFDNATSKTPVGLDTPHVIALKKRIVKAFSSSSSMHSFFLAEDGGIYAMGRNDHGQLGIGSQTTENYPVLMEEIHSRLSVSKISTGRSHSLFLMSNGEVYGCGSNEQGQLGLGENKTALRDSLRPVKLPFTATIRDIACGYDHSLVCNTSGQVFAFGHPEYGQLGFGSNGSFIKDGGKGAAVQYRCVTSPRQIEMFVQKDSRGKLEAEIPASQLCIRAVAAGRNHSMCLEDWEDGRANRVFSWGFGGYGRLGHTSGNDEFLPRDISTFAPGLVRLGPDGQPPAPNPQKIIVDIVCGSTYSLAISKSKAMYFWGKLSNSPRGEATMYPKMVMDLYGWQTRLCCGGSNSVFVAADDAVIAWGAPVAGKFGLEGGAKSSTGAKIVEAVSGLKTLSVSCGYGHVCFVVCAEEGNAVAEAKLAALPELPGAPADEGGAGESNKPSKKGGKKGAADVSDSAPTTGKGKKRAAEAPAAAAAPAGKKKAAKK